MKRTSFLVLVLKGRASLVAQTVKRLPAMWETRVRFLGREDPLEKDWQSTPALLPGKSHGRRSLIGYSPWGRKESDIFFIHSSIDGHWGCFHILAIVKNAVIMEMEMATHSSILAGKFRWTEQPGRLQSIGSQKSQTRLSN